ncbi:MAG: carotenoid biosynthesis protein [Bacteroidota bacterium]
MNYQRKVKHTPSIFFNIEKDKLFRPAVIFLAALHFFGLLGMHLPIMNEYLQLLTHFESFISLTPLNLLLTAGMLLLFHKTWNKYFLIFLLASMLIGFFAEVLGVATGLVFGEYQYGATLGWKVLEVPLAIGLNWFLLSYFCSSLLHKVSSNIWIKTIAAAFLMVLLDMLIEPVAMQYDFWNWAGNVIPFQNYVAWFFIALFPCFLFYRLPFEKSNPFAKYVFGAQLLFFLFNNLLLF